MIALLDVYRAFFKNEIALQLQYRVQLIIWLLFGVIQPVMYLVIWSTVARSRGGQVGDYGVSEFAAYFIAIMLVQHLVFTWIMYEFEFLIRQGQLSVRLLRPIDPIHGHIVENLTYKLLTLTIMVPAAAILTLLFQPRFDTPLWAIAVAVPALLLAFLLTFLLEWSFALVAFWTTRTAALNDAYTLVYMFMSGWVAPLSLFPPGLQVLASILPFRWALAFPVELLLGRLTPQQALGGLAAQAVWLAIAVAIWKLTWRAGIRRYSAVGA
jgi:ABC-2 type transport system permease protein